VTAPEDFAFGADFDSIAAESADAASDLETEPNEREPHDA
jgi:hypothetical protein